MTSPVAIPTRLLLQPARLGMADGQRRLAEAQAESASGRHHDVGLVLGGRTGADISLRTQLAGLETTLSDVSQASLAAEATQGALTALGDVAGRFRSGLASARNAEGGRAIAASLAATSLGSLYDALSTTQDGQYLFSGLATDQAPLAPLDSGPRQEMRDAFELHFGYPPDDPAAASLSANAVTDFLDTSFAALFQEPAWSTIWSSASGETQRFRLPSGEAVSLSTTAAAPYAQKLVQAFAMIDLLGSSKLNATAFSAAVDRSLALASDAQVRTGDEQARIGIGQARLKDTRTSLEQRKASVSTAIGSLENIDPYEAATRINLLMNQLESSYALTGRISRMSLLSYI